MRGEHPSSQICRRSALIPDSPHITASLARSLIDRAFPEWSTLPVTPVPTSGWDNRTFRVGDQYLARLPSAALYADAIRKECAWLPRLAPALPLPVPEPLALIEPDDLFPYPWSVYRWIEGDTLASAAAVDDSHLAVDLARFLNALMEIDPTDGPRSAFRGGSIEQFSPQVEEAIGRIEDRIDADRAISVWQAACAAPLEGPPVWFHGDVAAGNLLLREGRLSAVIDFGVAGVGDPACDTVIAWTYFDEPARSRFREALHVDDARWTRGMGWALWKALIVAAELIDTNANEKAAAPRVLASLAGN